MRKIFTFFLCVFAASAFAQDLKFTNAGKSKFSSQIPLNELLSMKHYIDDSCTVRVESRNGAIYTAKAGNLKASTTPVDAILSTGNFATMTKVVSYNNFDELDFGDFVGVFNEADYTLGDFVQASFSQVSQYESSGTLLSLIMKEDSLFALQLALKNGTLLKNLRVHMADIVYVGEDSNGKKLPLSARLIYPYDIKNNNLVLSNIYVDNHVTVLVNGAEPTATLQTLSPAPVCERGYLVVQPDLMGFGASADHTQLFVDAYLNGSAIAYSVVAAMKYADWSRTRDMYGFKLANDVSVINTGESQGACSAISGTYFMENKMDAKYNFPTLKETRLCGGAYNMKLCMDTYCQADSITFSAKVPMLISGSVCHYPQYFGSYTVHDYFAPELKTTEYIGAGGPGGGTPGPGGFPGGGDPGQGGDPEQGGVPGGDPGQGGFPGPGEQTTQNFGTVWQILDCKEYHSQTVESALNELFASDEVQGYASLHKLLNAELFNADGTLNWDEPRLQALKNYFDQNNFASRSLWRPKNDISILHAENDDVIPYATAEEFYKNQNTWTLLGGNTITLNKLTDVPAITNGGNMEHVVTCLVWIMSEVTGLEPSILCTILQSALDSQDTTETTPVQ